MRFTAAVPIPAVLILIAFTTAMPVAHASTGTTPAATTPAVSVVSAGDSGLTIDFQLHDLATTAVTAAGETFQALAIPDGGFSGDDGAPAIPVFSRLVAVPDGAEVSVRATRFEERTMNAVRLPPVQAGDGSAPAYDPVKYMKPVASDEPGAVAGSPAMLRGVRVVPITFRPVRYDPATRTAKVAGRMRVEIDFTGAVRRSAAAAHRLVPPSFDTLYRQLLLNYDQISATLEVVPGTDLIICPTTPGVVDSLQRLVNWRQRSGHPTMLVTTETTGGSAGEIKRYIQDVYDNPAIALEYLTLVGDASGTIAMPTWYEGLSGYNGEGDLPYAELEGGDPLPDVNYGRLSVDNATTLRRVIDKTIGYETTPDMSDTGWFTRSCIVGDPSSSGSSCVETARWLAERLADIGYTQADTIYADPFVTQMQTSLNRGVSIFGYRGYLGMSGWSVGLSSALLNGGKMPFGVALTCATGSFAGGTSNSEGFFRAWNSGLGIPSGGIGCVGLATTGTHTYQNNCLYYGIWRGLIQEGLHTMGAAKTRGSLEMYMNYAVADPNRVEIWGHWSNLMGDPAVDVWTAVPSIPAVTHPAALARGASSVAVGVTIDGQPLEDALVCLWKGSETYVVRSTDASGQVELPVSTPTEGSMLLTVTQHNMKPYLATIPVTTAAMAVDYAGSSVNDDMTGESSGNGDGLVNPGETIELRVRLENFGTSGVTGLSAVLGSDDPYVTVTDAAETFADLAAGDSTWCADDFGFTLAPDCPDGHVIPFGLEVTGVGLGVHAHLELTATSADLVAGQATVYGGDAVLDPGETAQLSVRLTNGGHADAAAVTGTLISLSQHVTVLDASGDFGTIAVGASGENSVDRFTVRADSSTFRGYLAQFLLATRFSNGTVDTASFGVTVGTEGPGDPIGPDAHGYMAYDDTDTGYPLAPVYDWIELEPSLGGSGAEIVLGDYGGAQDRSRTVSMPFPFSYYGRSFSEATVCSNGWLALGRTVSTEYRNWFIPGAGGPNAMIAAFWDDLHQDGTSSRALQWYDSANHKWIVQWNKWRNASGAGQTFEIVLYDPAFYPTDTGDGIILVQYRTVNNNDSGEGYATVGIESPDQLDGLLYTFQNLYPAGAAQLAANRAIKFIPYSEAPNGTLSGTVRNASTGGTPLAGATVQVTGGTSFVSGADGSYHGHLLPGTYTVIATHAGFAPDTTASVLVESGRTTSLDMSLVDIAPPAITTTLFSSTEDTVGPYPIPVHITEYSGLPQKVLYYRTGPAPFTAVELVPQGGDDYLASIPGQPAATQVGYYVYARDGAGLESLDPPGAPIQLHLFTVGPMTVIRDDDFEAESGWTCGAPGDDATTGIWERSDPVASEYSGFVVQPEDDHTSDPGAICHVTGNANPGDPGGTNDVDGGQTTLLSPVYDLSSYMHAEVSYWLWYSNNRGSSTDDAWQVDVTADGTNWVNLEATTGSTAESWSFRQLSLTGYVPLTGHVQFRFIASDRGSGGLVEAAVDDFRLIGFAAPATGVETGPVVIRESGLDAARPNPFRSTAHLAYRIAQSGAVRLEIYDVSGRLIRRLVDGERTSGEYVASWDGRNAAGREVSPGLYFARMETAGRQYVCRMALMR